MEFFGFFVISILFAAASAEDKRYRGDYVYNKATNAFYKFHIETMRSWRAKEVCVVEGGQLMIPKSQQDIVQFHTLFKMYPDLGNYAWVSNDGNQHESAEEHPIIDLEPVSGDEELQSGECDVLTREGEVESYECYHDLPFICKIEAQDAVRDPRCDVYGKGYQYYPDIGSCYKIPRYVYSWNQGYEECKAEGAHLVIINSEAEHEVVWNVTKSSEAINGATTSWFFFAGLRATRTKNGEPREFLTIFNQTLDDAGYNQWSKNEPNNYQDTEYCGSIFKNDGKYNDLNCEHLYGFICEKEVHT